MRPPDVHPPSASGSRRTTAPRCGASIASPGATTMPTWCAGEPTNTRSPGVSASDASASGSAIACSPAAVGRPTPKPARSSAKSIRPEQSKPPSSRDSPPHTYGQPSWESAAVTTAAAAPAAPAVSTARGRPRSSTTGSASIPARARATRMASIRPRPIQAGSPGARRRTDTTSRRGSAPRSRSTRTATSSAPAARAASRAASRARAA